MSCPEGKIFRAEVVKSTKTTKKFEMVGYTSVYRRPALKTIDRVGMLELLDKFDSYKQYCDEAEC